MLAALLHPKKGRYENMHLNYCIKHNQQKKKLQTDYGKLGGTQPLKGAVHTFGLTRTKSAESLLAPKPPLCWVAPSLPESRRGVCPVSAATFSAQWGSRGMCSFRYLKSYPLGLWERERSACIQEIFERSQGGKDGDKINTVEAHRNFSSLPKAIRKQIP